MPFPEAPGGAEEASGPGGEEILTPLEARVVSAVDDGWLMSVLSALVAIPSWGGRETPAQESMAGVLEGLGMDVDVWEIDVGALRAHPAYFSELERVRPLGVVGRLPGAGGGRTLLLNGHVDVVPPGDEELWTHPPFRLTLRDGTIFGRGALDMKGPLCAALAALRALGTEGVRLRGDVLVESVVGEEDGGMGTLAAILRGYRADGAVVMEPTGLAVAPALAGALNFRVHVPGQAAHGAVRLEGVSAITNFIPLHRALETLEAERNRRLGGDPLFADEALPFPISVGTIAGGDWASSVPDRLAFEGRFGVAPGEDLDRARQELEEAVAEAARAHPWMRAHPPRVEWWGGQFEPARVDPAHPLVTAVHGAAASVLGRRPPLRAMTYGADMGLLVNHGGIPTVLFGPGDIRRAHRPDESVEMDELLVAARSLAVAMMRFCGV